MKALVVRQHGGPEVLRLEHVPEPHPEPGQVVVRVRVCGVCRRDLELCSGALAGDRPLPVIPGHEISGEVVELGPGVSNIKTGDSIATLPQAPCGLCAFCLVGQGTLCATPRPVTGGYAEYVALDATAAVKVPADVPWEQTCILGCPLAVAYRALVEVAQLQCGEDLLVTGAGGGLGFHSMLMGKACGARVLAVTNSPEKIERLQEAGADEVVFTPDLRFHEEVLGITSGQGADVVANTVGSAVFASCLRSLGRFGRLLLLGELENQPARVNAAEVFFRNARLLGSAGCTRHDLEAVVQLAQRNLLKPALTTFPLGEAATVHQMMLERQTFGRVVLTP